MTEHLVLTFIAVGAVSGSRPLYVVVFALSDRHPLGMRLSLPQARDLKFALDRLGAEPHFATADQAQISDRRGAIVVAREELNTCSFEDGIIVRNIGFIIRQDHAVFEIHGQDGEHFKLILDIAMIYEFRDITSNAVPIMEGKHHGSNSLH
ncbi:hypothetical protein V1281_001592 [Nitrobacteraceae bacterium AZCC 2161]